MTNEDIIKKLEAIGEQAQAIASNLSMLDIGQATRGLSRMMIDLVELQSEIVEEDPTLSPDILD